METASFYVWLIRYASIEQHSPDPSSVVTLFIVDRSGFLH